LEGPKILSTSRTRLSPWVDVVEKSVQFTPGGPAQVFHFMSQAAYVGMLVRTADGLIPIVRQYRPAVEEFTWEFPAGTLEDGETVEQAAQRELLEEIGIEAKSLVYLGNFHPDTGRLQIDSHAFYGTIPQASHDSATEPGLSVRYVTHGELKRMIICGEFRHQLHLAIYAAVLARDLSLD
jgi:ADP-ribose pyrophosphatase